MIRVATPEDVDLIYCMLQSMHAENIGYSDFAQDEQYVKGNLDVMLRSDSLRIFLDDTGRGFIMASASPLWFTPRVRVAEEVLYILPAHRGGTLAWRLVRKMEEWAKEVNAWQIVAGVSTGFDSAVQLYECAGYDKFGLTLVKRLEG